MSTPTGEEQTAPPPENPENIIPQPASPDEETLSLPINVVDAEGDLLLRVGAETGHCEQVFLVCSDTLRRSSLVWKRMFFGGFKESKPVKGEWIVALPYDEPAALLVILNIIHIKFDLVPETPGLPEVYQILSFANKYDAIGVLRPWGSDWMKVAENAQNYDDGDSIAMLTYVAWEFGNEELFTKMLDKLLVGSSIDGLGRLTTSNGVCLEDYDHLGPQDLLDMIRELRSALVQTLLDLVNAPMKKLLGDAVCCRQDNERDDCDYVILGSFWKGMADVRGSLLPESANEIMESFTDLAASVRAAMSFVRCPEAHTKCNPRENIKKIVRETVRQRKVLLRSSHIEYMQKQRQKTGLAEPAPAQDKK